MGNKTLPLPRVLRQYREHEVAETDRTEHLLTAIPEDPALLKQMSGRHFLSGWHLNRELILQLLRQSALYERGTRPYETTLSGQIIVNTFLEQPPSRTYHSFESATYSLGATIMNLNSVPNGGTDDIAAMAVLGEILSSYGDAIVLRTSTTASFDTITDNAQIPVINAGNGEIENPSQALVDLYTLFKWRPELMFPGIADEDKIQVGIFGAPGHTRTVNSLLILMSYFPWAFSRVVVFERVNQLFRPGQREELEASGLNIESTAELYDKETTLGCLQRELPNIDMLYSHRLQPLNLSKMDRDLARDFLKPNAMVLCPAAHMKDFGMLLDDSRNNGYFCQARNAVYIRMALLQAILG